MPWGKILVLSAVLFVNQFGSNMIFPFLPFMVHDFFPELDRQEIGKRLQSTHSTVACAVLTELRDWDYVKVITECAGLPSTSEESKALAPPHA